jgi:hypothetical protein
MNKRYLAEQRKTAIIQIVRDAGPEGIDAISIQDAIGYATDALAAADVATTVTSGSFATVIVYFNTGSNKGRPIRLGQKRGMSAGRLDLTA